MKKLLLPLIALILLASGCKKDKCEQSVSYWRYTPRYMQIEDIAKGVKTGPATPLKNVGKIFLTGHYILINEIQKGIHVIDNSNPSAPQNLAFITIPGNVDMAVKGTTLYADCYTALLSIDITNPTAATLVSTTKDALPQLYTTYADPAQGIVVGYDSTRVTDKTDCGNGGGGIFMYQDGFVPLSAASGTSNTSAPSSPNIAGSTTRFAVNADVLYIVDQSHLRVFNIANASAPIASGSANIGWNIETIFPYAGHLYIGTTTGMQIFNLSNPYSPQHDATFAHVKSCDPVIVSGHYAYVTIHAGTICGESANQLQVVDISNTTAPTLVSSYELHSPRGLSIDGSTLFICDGDEGLKVYDASDVNTVTSHQLGHFANMQSEDVIAYGKTLIMIGATGLYEYDYTDPQHITALGSITITK